MTLATPTLRTSLKRARFWVIAAIAAIVVGTITMVVQGATMSQGVYLSATNAGPEGAMAVAEVLRDQGVDVIVVDTAEDAEGALSGTDATLLLHDASNHLEPERITELAQLAAHTVLVEATFGQLREVAPAVRTAGGVSGNLEADCAVAAVTRAGTVTGGGLGYRVDTDEVTAQACLGSGDDIYSLIRIEQGGRALTVFGASDALTNERVAEAGNAALVLGLLGEHPTLVWYQPSLADVAGGTATIADLTPAWLSPVLALLALTVIAAGVWKGRRMGPLVVEHLPVTVPANETIDGRARLYQKSGARLRTLDALRVGTIARIGTACGLPTSASVAEVAGAAASVTGISLHEVRRLLLEAEPTTDRELIRLSDDLLRLETEVTRRARPGTDHTGRMNA